MINKLFNVTYNDFKLMETMDPDQFDQNNRDVVTKIDEIIDFVNRYEQTTDSNSGADRIGFTPIVQFAGKATVQQVVEALVERLVNIAKDTSGADFIGSSPITGVAGDTVKKQLESLKSILDSIKSTMDLNEADIEQKMADINMSLGIHRSSTDHDSRYYTKPYVDGMNGSFNSSISTLGTSITNHKSSTDHDARYYDKAQVDAFLLGVRGIGYTGQTLRGLDDKANNIQTQINNLNNTYSTDAERIAAINDVINQFQIADSDMNTLILNKANSSDVYTRAQVDALVSNVYTKSQIDTKVFKTANYENGSVTIEKLDPTIVQTAADGVLLSEVRTPTYTTPVEATASVISMPANVVDSQLCDLTLKGNTRRNYINGEISQTSFKSVVGLTPNALYCVSVASVLNATSWRFRLKFFKNGVDVTSIVNWANINYAGGVYYNDATGYITSNANGAVTSFTFANIDSDRVDITLGSGDVTTTTISTGAMVEQGVNARGSYISYGTKSTLPVRVKSVGKNLWNPNNPAAYVGTGATWNGVNGTVQLNNYVKWLIKGLKPNTQYTASALMQKVSGSQVLIWGADLTNYTVIGTTKQRYSITYTSNAQGEISTLGIRTFADNSSWDTFTAEDFMLVEGTSATPYEPFVSGGEAYTPADVVLRSLNNGTKDEHSVITGVRTQKVSDAVIIDGNGTFEGFVAYTGVYRAQISSWCVNKNILQSVNNSALAKSNDGDYKVINYAPTSDTTTKAINFGHSTSNNTLYIAIEKSKIDAMPSGGTLAGVKEYLNQYPITLNYQLASPITTKVAPAQSIVAYPNGTLMIEPAVYDVGYYRSSVLVERPTFPIKALSFVNKINVDDGTFTSVDLSKCTVASDGLSFTINSAVYGEYYEYAYEYDATTTTLPTVRYAAAVNLKAQVDTNTRTIARLDNKVDDVSTRVDAVKGIADGLTAPLVSNPVTVNNGIATLPASVVVGSQFSDIVIKGRTLKNELNYNRDTWAEWSIAGAGSTKGANGIHMVADGGNEYAVLPTNIKANTKYGLLYLIASKTITKTDSFLMSSISAFGAQNMPNGAGNNKIVLTSLATITNNQIRLSINSTESDGAYIDFKDIRVFELPAGSEIEADFNTLTADQLAQKYPYIRGGSVVSTLPVRIKSVNENLMPMLPEQWEQGSISASDGASIAVSSRIRTKLNSGIKVLPNTEYTVAVATGYNAGVHLYDKDGNWLQAVLNGSWAQTRTFTTTNNTGFLRLVVRFANDAAIAATDIVNTQALVRKGNVSTYIPHTYAEAYTPADIVLRSLPNGVKDEHSVITGVKTQRVSSNLILNGSEDWVLYTPGVASETLKVYKATSLLNVVAKPKDNNTVGGILSDKFTSYSFNNSVYDNKQKGIALDYNGNLFVTIESTIAPDAIAFKAWLAANPVSLFYQLASPIESKYTPGSLIAYPNGTIYVELADGSTMPDITFKYSMNRDAQVRTISDTMSNMSQSVSKHMNEESPHVYKDRNTNVKYRLVMIDGKAYMEVVSI